MAQLTVKNEITGGSSTIELDNIREILLYGRENFKFVSCEHCYHQARTHTLISNSTSDWGASTQVYHIHQCPYCLGRGWYQEGNRGSLIAEEIVALFDKIDELEEKIECAIDALDYECIEDARFALDGS